MTVAPTEPTPAAQALARRRENGEVAVNSLADQIRKMEKQFQLAMPRGAEATQLIRDALTSLRTTKNLDKCESGSVLGALMTCAQLGLRPAVLGQAWILPFWDNRNRGYKAQLVLGYQGLIELALRSGRISSLIARTVYSNDVFEVDYGLADSLVHRPAMFDANGEPMERGRPIAYYAVAKFTSGGHAFIVMTQREMEFYRDKHATAKTREGKVFGPWVDHFEGMAHKTCIRQLAKYMPKSTDLAVALAADEGVRVDISPTNDAAEVTEHLDFVEGEVIEEEQAGPPAEAPVSGPPNGNGGRPATAKQRKDIAEAAETAGIEADGLPAYASDVVGRDVASLDELSNREAATVLSRVQAFARQQEPPAADGASS